jgi:hypothetical protein
MMTFNDWAYLFTMSVVITFSYFPIALFLHFFFNSKPRFNPHKYIVSCTALLVFSLTTYMVSIMVPNFEMGNRIIHTFGGGFLVYMACFFAAKDTHLAANKLKFAVLCFMLVMTLGVFNEIVEYVLQNYFNFTAAPHINDTWLDLISNTVGCLIAIGCFTPFLNRVKK